MLLVACLFVAATVARADSAAERSTVRLAGLPLTAAIQVLQARGLTVVFSSNVVLPSMRVEREPAAGSPRAVLDEILAPHGLRAVEGARGRLVVVVAPRPASEPASERTAPHLVVPRFTDEIVVTPGAGDLPPAATPEHSLAASELAVRPHRDDDVFRALAALPGTATREDSSQVNVRGGRDGDVLILLDGIELLAPYHLQELDSALSIVAPTALERVDLVPSGYPAELGDRMGGVLHLTTATPARGRHLSLGLGLTHADAAASGRLASERGSWYASARGGSYSLALELDGERANPRFWDAFGKGDYELRAGHSLRLSTLVAGDQLSVEPASAEHQGYSGEWSSRYAWLTQSSVLGSSVGVETMASVGEIERERSAQRSAPQREIHVRDRRSLRLAAIKQLWSLEPRGRFSLAGGVEVRELGASVDYFNERRLAGAISPLRSQPGTGNTTFAGRFDFDRTALFSTVRLRLDRLTSELGVRHDHDNFTTESHVSPRLNLAWAAAPSTVARLAWGWYYQSQRPNELQVEDDETLLRTAERAEHRVLQLEHRLSTGTSFRLEAFDRRTTRGRPRFENLFEPAAYFPELEDDRIRIAPMRGHAEGVELGYAAGRGAASWRLAYTWSRAVETIDGRQVPRAIDQRNAVNAGIGYRTTNGWSFDAAWTYHSGWPTTAVWARDVVADDGTVRFEPVLGPLRDERLPAYHRLDLRVSRAWEAGSGRLSAFVDLQNVYDRENRRGQADFRFVSDATEAVHLDSRATTWGGFLPSFGLRWTR